MSVRTLLLVCALTSLLGGVALALKAHNTAAYQWEPFSIALPLRAGEISRAEFIADSDQTYDLLLMVDATLPESRLKALIGDLEPAEALDLRWQITLAEQRVAHGTAEARLYVSSGGRTTLGKLRRTLMSIPFHIDGGSYARAIGRIRSRAGQKLVISVERGDFPESLDSAHPRLVLRLAREVWLRHTRGMDTVAYAGFALFAISAMFGLLLLMKLMARRR